MPLEIVEKVHRQQVAQKKKLRVVTWGNYNEELPTLGCNAEKLHKRAAKDLKYVSKYLLVSLQEFV